MTNVTTEEPGKELTGGMVFTIMATLFGIIISVNVFMAYSAISTFPGLVVKNSYVASQKFDAQRAAQEALGLTFAATYDGTLVDIDVVSLATNPIGISELNVVVGRPTHDRDDIELSMSRTSGGFAGPAVLEAGAWVVRLSGVAEDGTAFRHDMGLSVRR